MELLIEVSLALGAHERSLYFGQLGAWQAAHEVLFDLAGRFFGLVLHLFYFFLLLALWLPKNDASAPAANNRFNRS